MVRTKFYKVKVKISFLLMSCKYLAMNANGTAIGVVCVTGAANRPVVPVVGMELSRWQAGMARYLQSRVRLV
jgi:hypothetical protein